MRSRPVDQADPGATRTRRRFARRQWARRWGAWRWVAGLVLLIGLAAGGSWLVFSSSVLAVQGSVVSGTGYLTAEQVRGAAQVPIGEPLATVDLDAIANRVEALAPVESVDVTRQWPDQVRIVLTERTPVAVVDVGGSLRGMDPEGVLFREYPRLPGDLPVVHTFAGADAEARREAAGVVAAMPAELAARVDHLEVVTMDQITLVLRDGRNVIWGSARDSVEKAKVLGLLLRHRAQQYDVSVPAQPTTRS